LLLGFLPLALSTATAEAPDGAGGNNEASELYLTISDCISRALLKNLDISIQRIGPQVAATQTLSAHGIYDPVLILQGQYGASQEQIVFTSDAATNTQSSSSQLSLSQLTALGTQLSLNGNYSSTQTDIPANLIFAYPEYTSLASFSLTQPLLKGFGTNITEAQIRIARHGEAVANAEFQLQVEQIISNVVTAYYEMLYARDNLASLEASVALARQFLDDNQARARIGTMTPLDISQAASDAASRQDAVLQARQTLSEQENALKRLISDDFAGMVAQEIVLLDKPAENLNSQPPLREMATALENRPDYREAIARAEQSKIQLVFSQNQVLPQLNLNASYGFGGLGTTFGNSFSRVTSTGYPQWFVGMSMQFPIGDRTAVGQLNAARLQKAQTLLQLKKLEQDILLQVNNAANRVKTNQDRVGVSRTAAKFAGDALAAEQEKLRAGTSTTYTVLQMQRDLALAETNELRALADLHESQVELFRVEGLTLKVYHVALDRPSSSGR
jgi:outer membrane protein TolC